MSSEENSSTDLQESKEKKLEELKQFYLKQQEEQQKKAEMESQVQGMLKRFLDENAWQRLSNVRLVNETLYAKAFQAIMALVQKGYVRGKLNEEQLKQVLMQLKENREISIKRK